MLSDETSQRIIVIGASAGGVGEIRTILNHLNPKTKTTIIVALHRSATHRSVLRDVLATYTAIPVRDAVNEDKLACGAIFVGAPDEQLRVVGSHFSTVRDFGIKKLERIDDLMMSVARSAGSNAIGVILSGSLSDGVEGLVHIAKAGGHCIVQRPVDARFDSMPLHALQRVQADFVGTALEIVTHLNAYTAKDVCRL